ncbi:MAG: ATP synthase F1 subunit epsilon [Chloroflexota bacterium]
MPMRCEIVTQDRLLYEGEAEAVIAPGTEGELGILPHHAPLLTTLDIGILRVRAEGGEMLFTIAGGVMEVLPDRVTVLADVGENVEEIDIQRAEKARQRAQELLERKEELAPAEYAAIEAALRRSNLRLDAARRYHPAARRRPGPGGGEEG